MIKEIKLLTIATLLMLWATTAIAVADNGHSLWLRMQKNEAPAKVSMVGGKTETMCIAQQELQDFWRGKPVILTLSPADTLKNDGFRIEEQKDDIVLSAKSDKGLLYAAYHILRGQNVEAAPEYIYSLSLPGKDSATVKFTPFVSEPKIPLRLLNHWDNLNGTVERGYAGRSIFWSENGVADLNIIKEYARANASIGINATVLNNVNAKPQMLTKAKLLEVKRIADVLRPYGIKVFLSVNFATPKALGELKTADPLDKNVKRWWAKKVKEIYGLIPDFGGFLVKANSEGEPGPMDYHRSHADGANMLADALKPFKGIVMWRSFVYAPSSPDRASQAYDEFMPLDGQFRSNVIIQVKNGPIDFQPTEPVSPLFFGMKKTPVMPELQITQEYLGESIHTVFLPSMWNKFFREYTEGINERPASYDIIGKDTIAVEEEYEVEQSFPAIAGVANIGNDANWCGSEMAQANWYAYGRMAWNPEYTAAELAAEWAAQTFMAGPEVTNFISTILKMSYPAAVSYMMPLGLHHIFAGGHHYGPEPWCDPEGWREDWKPKYYHRADAQGLGFDRTIATGTKNIAQYPKALREKYENLETCPEEYLLWFHHVPWDYKVSFYGNFWNTLCNAYANGIFMANMMSGMWYSLKPYIESDRHAAQQRLFDRQAKDAQWWHDACLLYFQQFSKMPIPADNPKPTHTLDELMKFNLGIDNYTTAPIDRLP